MKQAVKELLFSHPKRKHLMQPVPCLTPPREKGPAVPFHRATVGSKFLLRLRGRVGRGESWQGSKGTEGQEQEKGSRKTTKTDRVEEAG